MKSSDYHLHIQHIKKGQIFYESERGVDIVWQALEDCRTINKEGMRGYICKVKGSNKEMELFEAFKCGGHGLKLYNITVYGNIV